MTVKQVKMLIYVYGIGGTGFTRKERLKQLNYKGKVRVLPLGTETFYRPKNLFFDCIHILGTHTLNILKEKTINFKEVD